MHDPDSDSDIITLVDEEYLQLLVSLANERFAANAERIKRFSEHFFGGEEGKKGGRGEGNNNSKKEWEDDKVRQARKRAEGLKIQAGVRNTSIPNTATVDEEEDLPLVITTVASE